jgi:hypothetical protein
MQRRRSTNPDAEDVPVLTDSIEDDDFPVLLDIDAPPLAVEAIAEAPAITEIAEEYAAHPLLDAGIRDILAHELARRVEQRLTAELPRLIESTVRDFLAEQEMIAALQARD